MSRTRTFLFYTRILKISIILDEDSRGESPKGKKVFPLGFGSKGDVELGIERKIWKSFGHGSISPIIFTFALETFII